MRWPFECPLRSLLFVPGSSPEKIRKSRTFGADGIIFDLEDAVPEAGKAEARKFVKQTLNITPKSRNLAFVRINPWNTRHWQGDVNAVVGKNLRGIVLPKCESPQAVTVVSDFIGRQEKAKGLEAESISIFLLIESAGGLLRASGLTEASHRVSGLIFGAEDLCSEMGVSQPGDPLQLLYARSHISVCARAFGCAAIDTIYADFKNTQGLRSDTELCKQLGFSGKLAIHPNQIEVIHSVFEPSGEELEEAKEILVAFAQAQTSGDSVAVVNGKMVDKPIAERARRTIAMAKLAARY